MTASTSAFDDGLSFIWQKRYDGHQDDSAPGETFRTSWGVTQATWDHACQDGIVSGSIDGATQPQCARIYRAFYWNALRCDDFAPGVALVMFVDATLMGTGHVARSLQRIVGTEEDGIIGPITIAAARAIPADTLIRDLIQADIAYLGSLANADEFIRGWTRREDQLRVAALAFPAETTA